METIEDIVREMRGQGGDDGYPLDIKRYSDRIEAALKRERAQHVAVLRAQIDEVQRCAYIKDENDSLRAALKPVLKCNPNSASNGHDWAIMNINAVREAKRIYNESDVK